MNTTNNALDDLDAGTEPKLVLPGKGMNAGAGWDWIGGGGRLFAKAPLMWIITLVILFVIAIAVSLVPIIGSLAFQVLMPVFGAGLIVACHSLERGGEFELEHLFAGFRTHFANLIVVGLLYMAGGIVILLVLAMFVGATILTALLTGDPNEVVSAVTASALSLALGGLVAAALGLLLVAAYWFAPALVIMHGMAPFEAMKTSFFACFRNFVPFLIWGIVMLVASVIAAIPFGLGFLVLIPIAIASNYVAYRQIFTE